MVRRMALAGMDFFKTCATGGFQWEHEGLGTPDYSLEELQALVEEAHMRGRQVHVHAHAQPGIQNAVDAACDVILHGANIDSATLEAIASKKLIYMPTLYITSEQAWGLTMTQIRRALGMKFPPSEKQTVQDELLDEYDKLSEWREQLQKVRG